MISYAGSLFNERGLSYFLMSYFPLQYLVRDFSVSAAPETRRGPSTFYFLPISCKDFIVCFYRLFRLHFTFHRAAAWEESGPSSNFSSCPCPSCRKIRGDLFRTVLKQDRYGLLAGRKTFLLSISWRRTNWGSHEQYMYLFLRKAKSPMTCRNDETR